MKSTETPTTEHSLIGWRHRLLAWIAARLNLTVTYTIKFLPTAGRKRLDYRGRSIRTFTTMSEARTAFIQLAEAANRKEKTDGIYYLEIETREGLVVHTCEDGTATESQPEPASPLFSQLPEAAAGGPAAAAAPQAEIAQAQGAVGLGALGRRDPRDQAAAEPGRPVGYVIGPIGPAPAPDPVGPSLDDLGRR